MSIGYVTLGYNDETQAVAFYDAVTDAAGAGVRTVNLEGPRPRDIEDMSMGPCGAATCPFLGDIGDNPGTRTDVVFTLVRETADFADTETPLRAVRARYPDGPHNAEAFAVHPNGDLFLITKPTDARMLKREPALVYRLTARQLRDAGQTQVFEKLGQIDLPTLTPDGTVPDWIATSMDISPDGRRVALLTYGAVYELAVDLAKGLPKTWTAGQNLQIVRFRPLPQQEAIAWLPDASGVLIDTEANSRPTAPLLRVPCQG